MTKQKLTGHDAPVTIPENKELLPLPFQNKSFLCFLGTQALGAFNDNVFKQLVLLLGVGYTLAGIEYQAVVQFLFALPFLLFSGLAGDLSDRFGKGRLMVLCKVAEVIIALLGVGAFLMITVVNSDAEDAPLYLCLLAGVAFLLGAQSAFFGPPKYGGLPELVRANDLASATGLTQMTTFLAIIFGVAVAGLLADLLVGRMYLAGLVTVGIALLGTFISLGIARNPPADRKRHLSAKSFISMLPTLSGIYRSDPLMMRIMLVYSWFWFVGGVTLTSVNAFGRFQLGLSNFETSLMVAMTSLGIAIGSVLVGRMSRGKVNIRLVVPALLVLVICLLSLSLIPVHGPTAENILAFNQVKNSPELLAAANIFPLAPISIRAVAFCLFLMLGAAAGFFSVPLLTFIQARPSSSEKGRVFASVNWLNWIFILASAIAYGVGMKLFANHANLLLGVLGVATLLVGLILLPGIFRLLKHDKADFI
ncbi:MFS transporter [Methyloprofundus sp.]|uniref:MFS transporter n=1 Tax=Methyloprofundus sp. TaxID=2020875 RepID=UPI003D148458